MSKAESSIPRGHHSLSPHLIIAGAAKAIEFYKVVFGAIDVCQMPMPDGRVGHAELKIGDSVLFLADEFPEMGGHSPLKLGGSPVCIHLYVEDVDAVFNRAVKHGATVKMPPADMFWGDRYGKLTDPFGHEWSVATHLEDLSEQEVIERGAAAMASMSDCGSK